MVCGPTAVEYPLTTHDASPDSASDAVQADGPAGTEPKTYEPPFVSPPPVKAIEPGAVRSTRTFDTEVEEPLPATSTANPVALCPTPWPNRCAGEQLATPEPVSEHRKEAVG